LNIQIRECLKQQTVLVIGDSRLKEHKNKVKLFRVT